ncbi:uncharacterized protein HaLaN_32735, partial [Haematococcus lacustris]
PSQRKRLRPALVWAEICSYLKGSAEAVATELGHLSLDTYLALGARRAANFSREMREVEVWPVFCRYQRVKRQ